MSIANSIIKEAQTKMVLLSRTQTIDDSMLADPVWMILDKEYREAYEGDQQIVVSVLNSFVCQRRKVACFTRKGLRQIIESDKNWERVGRKSPGFDNDRYKQVLGFLTKGVFSIVERHGKKPMIVKFTVDPLLNFLLQDEAVQLQEATDFVSNYSADQEADLDVRSERQEARGEMGEDHIDPSALQFHELQESSPNNQQSSSRKHDDLFITIFGILHSKDFLGEKLSDSILDYFCYMVPSLPKEEFMAEIESILLARFKPNDRTADFRANGKYYCLVKSTISKAYDGALFRGEERKIFNELARQSSSNK